jgi:hypothetical protein
MLVVVNVRNWWLAVIDRRPTRRQPKPMRKYALSLIAGLGSAVVGQVPIGPDPSSLAYRLDVASEEASARRYCPSSRQRSFQQDFEGRYGPRIKKLVAFHSTRFGADPPVIHILTCIGFVGSDDDQDTRHRQAMEAFAPQLRVLEQKFGPP